jgi:hypothetical protein
MPELTRRRSLDASEECWHVYYGDVRVASYLNEATTRKFGMKTILSIMGATALLASAASAAPLKPAAVGIPEASNIEQVRVACNQFGRCWRTGGPRYVYRNYSNGYRSYYNYYEAPGYYTFPGYGYYGGGLGIGFGFGGRPALGQ